MSTPVLRSTESDHFAAAIRLNNMAVTMAERGCVNQAFVTFKDAVMVANAVFKQQPGRSPFFLKNLLEKAIQRMVHPTVTTTCPSIEVVSHDSADFCITARPYSNDKKTLIQIDSTDEDILQADDLTLAILLYNFAITTTQRQAGQGLVDNLLSCSLSILYSLQDNLDDPFLLKRIVFVTAHALESLVPALRSSGKTQEADARAEELLHFLGVATRLECSGLFSAAPLPASAA
jgi:hypothetical protein